MLIFIRTFLWAIGLYIILYFLKEFDSPNIYRQGAVFVWAATLYFNSKFYKFRTV